MENLNALQTAARNKDNYLKAKRLFNQNMVDECVLYYAEDHEVKSKQSEKGRDGIKAFLDGLHESWTDINITVEHAVAEKNWVMGRSVATATHAKMVLGVPPTNRQIVAAFWDLHLFNDEGLIIETWNLMDNLAIMQQLGILKGQIKKLYKDVGRKNHQKAFGMAKMEKEFTEKGSETYHGDIPDGIDTDHHQKRFPNEVESFVELNNGKVTKTDTIS